MQKDKGGENTGSAVSGKVVKKHRHYSRKEGSGEGYYSREKVVTYWRDACTTGGGGW
jgi:hypothetical protein